MSNLVPSKIKKKLKNFKLNKNSDNRVYKFDETALSQTPSWVQVFGKKSRSRKYQPTTDSSTVCSYQTGSTPVASTVADSDVSFHNESNQKVNRNTFFRNGWVTNLDHIEERRNLISDEISAGYGAIQNESKTDYDIGEQKYCEVIATISLKSLE